MAKLTPEGRELRLQLCAHLRKLYEEYEFRSQKAMAERMGMDPGHFSVLYRGEDDIGLDVAVRMHRAFGKSLDYFCDSPPEARFYPPDMWPGMHLGKPPPAKAGGGTRR